MLDLEKINLPIKHTTECIPGVLRNEVYTLDHIKYTEQYYDPEGTFATGFIEMYDGVRVGLVGKDGSVSVNMPCVAVGHKTMTWVMEDLKRIDAFLCAINEKYNNG